KNGPRNGNVGYEHSQLWHYRSGPNDYGIVIGNVSSCRGTQPCGKEWEMVQKQGFLLLGLPPDGIGGQDLGIDRFWTDRAGYRQIGRGLWHENFNDRKSETTGV